MNLVHNNNKLIPNVRFPFNIKNKNKNNNLSTYFAYDVTDAEGHAAHEIASTAEKKTERNMKRENTAHNGIS